MGNAPSLYLSLQSRKASSELHVKVGDKTLTKFTDDGYKFQVNLGGSPSEDRCYHDRALCICSIRINSHHTRLSNSSAQ